MASCAGSGLRRFREVRDGLIKLECFHDLSRVPFAFALGDTPGISPICSKHFQTYFVILVSFNPFSTTLVIRTVRFGSWHPSYVRATSQTGGAVMLPSWRQDNYRHIQACGIRMVSSGWCWLIFQYVCFIWLWSIMVIQYTRRLIVVNPTVREINNDGTGTVRPTWMTNVWMG